MRDRAVNVESKRVVRRGFASILRVDDLVNFRKSSASSQRHLLPILSASRTGSKEIFPMRDALVTAYRSTESPDAVEVKPH